MPLEIERKFLVTADGWRAAAHKVVPMTQGYLNDLAAASGPPPSEGTMKVSVRARIEGDRACLNLKSREPGPARQEFEYAIPVEDARSLLALCVGGLVDKRRHYVEFAGHLWEVDEFLGDNAGLVVAEIELASTQEAFEKPGWVGREVTDCGRYYNLALAARPYSRWSGAERAGATDPHSNGEPQCW